jgi:hypothetical protein
MELAMSLLRRKKKVWKRLPVDFLNFFARPIVPQSGSGCRNACIVMRQGHSSEIKI